MADSVDGVSAAAPADDGDNDHFSVTPHQTFTADGPDTGVDAGVGIQPGNVSLPVGPKVVNPTGNVS